MNATELNNYQIIGNFSKCLSLFNCNKFVSQYVKNCVKHKGEKSIVVLVFKPLFNWSKARSNEMSWCAWSTSFYGPWDVSRPNIIWIKGKLTFEEKEAFGW